MAHCSQQRDGMAVDSLTRWVIVMVLYSQVALRTGDCQTKWSRAVLVQLGDKLHGWPARVCVQYHFFLLRTPCHRSIKILWRWVGLERAQFRASDLVLSPCMSLRPVRSKTAQTQASPHHLQLSRHRLDEPELQVEQLQIVQWYDIV